MSQSYDFTRQKAGSLAINAFMQGVYRWMTAGLAVTAVVAWLVVSWFHSLTEYEFYNFINTYKFLMFVLIIAELGLVVALSAAVQKMSSLVASSMFLLFSALNGLTISVTLYFYQTTSIVSTFITCALMFAGISLYGMFTKRDLTGVGSICFMGLIGLIVASIINFFMRSPAFSYLISIVGVLVFTGLTAYDSQKLRMMGESTPVDDAVAVRRGTILGALTLYLDFINLFLMLLRIMGRRN